MYISWIAVIAVAAVIIYTKNKKAITTKSNEFAGDELVISELTPRKMLKNECMEHLEWWSSKYKNWIELSHGTDLSVGVFEIDDAEAGMLVHRVSWMLAECYASMNHVESVIDEWFGDGDEIGGMHFDDRSEAEWELWRELMGRIKDRGHSDACIARMNGHHQHTLTFRKK
ncbi:hypothetical protein ACEF96_003147 [Salmonella enterica]|nr:hypothetical protein [Salmonella enterica]